MDARTADNVFFTLTTCRQTKHYIVKQCPLVSNFSLIRAELIEAVLVECLKDHLKFKTFLLKMGIVADL